MGDMSDTEETLERLAAIPNLNVVRSCDSREPYAVRNRRTRGHLRRDGESGIIHRGAWDGAGERSRLRGDRRRNEPDSVGCGVSRDRSQAGCRSNQCRRHACRCGRRRGAAGPGGPGDCGRPAGHGNDDGDPGIGGAAVYGNAGAYGHSISERVEAVRFFDGGKIRSFSNAECEFHYRESIFKKNKDWIILSATLGLSPANPAELKAKADGILGIRNEKYPPTMKCAGSIFKNFLFAELPPGIQAALPANVVREGKVPSAYFLEKVDAKGMSVGDIHVATYHANLIYNAGSGTAQDLRLLIAELKRRVWERFGITLEEEVQYVGTPDFTLPPDRLRC